MPRKPREEVENGVHHVYARGNRRQPIYLDDHDRKLYLALLARTVAAKRWRCLSYCLMDNHVHLLIQTPEANLGAGMQRMHGYYGRNFNERHDKSGHLFQGRYGAELVTDEEQMWTVVPYIARNPVKARRCRKPSEWPWSSHADVLRGTGPEWLDRDQLLSFFTAAGGQPLTRYRECVEAG